MNRHRLALISGVRGVDIRHEDPTGPYYLVEDVHQLLRRFQLLRFHTAQCRCWDCDALQKDIAATLGESPAQETPVVVEVDFAKAGSDSTVFWCPKCQQQLPSADVIHDCPTPNR